MLCRGLVPHPNALQLPPSPAAIAIPLSGGGLRAVFRRRGATQFPVYRSIERPSAKVLPIDFHSVAARLAPKRGDFLPHLPAPDHRVSPYRLASVLVGRLVGRSSSTVQSRKRSSGVYPTGWRSVKAHPSPGWPVATGLRAGPPLRFARCRCPARNGYRPPPASSQTASLPETVPT